MTGTTLSPRHENWKQVIHSYIQLTKPRIIPLLLITTAASMWIASQGQIDPKLLLITLLGGSLAAASAQVMNCIYDRDIDYEMERTRRRPIPAGRIQIKDAIIFAIVLGSLSFGLLAIFVNLLSAALAMAGILVYMVIYTHLLKRNHPQNIVIGGAAGAIPPLVGWAAVTGEIGWAAWVLFALVFVWTPPHFWALALMIRDDYAKVGVPMLPVVEGEAATVKQIWVYTWMTIFTSILLIYPLHSCGGVYGLFALGLGAGFLAKVQQLQENQTDKTVAKSVFKYSIAYMMLLCTGMAIDSLPISHQLSQQLLMGLSHAL